MKFGAWLTTWEAATGSHQRVVVASDCEHAAEVAARWWRLRNGAFPRIVRVRASRGEWECRVDQDGNAKATRGPGITPRLEGARR